MEMLEGMDKIFSGKEKVWDSFSPECVLTGGSETSHVHPRAQPISREVGRTCDLVDRYLHILNCHKPLLCARHQLLSALLVCAPGDTIRLSYLHFCHFAMKTQ